MRANLQPLEGKKLVFFAFFGRYGIKRETILLYQVTTLAGIVLTDHVWVRSISAFGKIHPINEGDVIKFTATIKRYQKGYLGDDINLRLAKKPMVDYTLIGLQNVKVFRKHDLKKYSALGWDIKMAIWFIENQKESGHIWGKNR